MAQGERAPLGSQIATINFFCGKNPSFPSDDEDAPAYVASDSNPSGIAMPLPLVSYLPFHKASANPVELPFLLQRLSHRQSRLQGRYSLMPEINLDAFRFQAVIDWVEIKFELASSTQHQHVQTELRKHLDRNSHIDAADAGSGNVAETFVVKVQEPTSVAVLLDVADTLEARYGFRIPPTITGIEISLDAYSKKNCSTERALLLGVMQHTICTSRDIWTNQNDRPRSIYGSNREVDQAKNDEGRGVPSRHYLCPSPEGVQAEAWWNQEPKTYKAPALDGTMYLGGKDRDMMIRIMDKIMDRQRPEDGTRDDLADDKKRVRIEVTLKGAELTRQGLNRLDDLQHFDFSKLQKDYFRFMLPTFLDQNKPMTRAPQVARREWEDWRAKVFHRAGVIGLVSLARQKAQIMRNDMKRLRADFRARKLTPPKIRAGSNKMQDFVAYETLTKKVRIALSNLMKREKRAIASRATQLSSR